MKKSDLINGLLVVLRDGSKCVVSEIGGSNYIIDIENGAYIDINFYSDDLKYLASYILDVVKIYEDYTCNKLLWQRELPQLSEIDRKQLEIFKELGFTNVKRDSDNDILIYNVEEISDISCFFRKMFNTLEYEVTYLIEDLLKGE